MQSILAYNPSTLAQNPDSGKYADTEIDFTDSRWDEHVFNPVPYVRPPQNGATLYQNGAVPGRSRSFYPNLKSPQP